jgi:hypothetical protein
MRPLLTIVDAIKDPNIFRPFFVDLDTWKSWRAVLHCIYGLPQLDKHRRLVQECTGRDPGRMPIEGFRSTVLLTGRRSGKSRVVSVVCAFEALFAGHEKRLSKGEQGLVACISPTRRQSSIVKSYIRSIFELPMLKPYLVRETKDGFELSNGIRIEVLTGDYRSIRGFSLVAAIVDEICFFGDEDTFVKSDTELVRALKPALLTTKGKLIGISSPYGRTGWAYQQWEKNFGNDHGHTLVWNAPSRTMNPTLDQEEIDRALAEDYEAARAEYLGEWRDDVAGYISRDLVMSCVVHGRDYISPVLANGSSVAYSTRYTAFCDLSGGRSDAASLAIAHKEDRKVIVDLVKHYKAPFVPEFVIEQMANELKRYKIHKVYGDAYAAEFVVQSFKRHRITYERCEKNKSELYLDLLPRMTSQQIELPDNETLIKELSSLERRTRSGRRDSVDHPRNGHDDLANSVAGVSFQITKAKKAVGLF